MDMQRLVKVYLKIRDKRSENKRAFEAEDSGLKAQQERIEAELLRHLNETKSESSRTEAGTFYRQEDVVPSGMDWAAFYDWIKKNDAFDALERRVKKTFITDYMEEHDGELPPGVNIYRRYLVRVRKPST